MQLNKLQMKVEKGDLPGRCYCNNEAGNATVPTPPKSEVCGESDPRDLANLVTGLLEGSARKPSLFP